MTDAELEATRDLLLIGRGDADFLWLWRAADALLAEVDRLRDAVQQEREACVQVVENMCHDMYVAETIATAIRQRGAS